jgi:NADPH:quinone reductase-like Zn-dependent oxidoreductase
VARKANDDLWSSVISGEIRSPIDKVFDIEHAAIALDRMSKNQHFGKIVLLVND